MSSSFSFLAVLSRFQSHLLQSLVHKVTNFFRIHCMVLAASRSALDDLLGLADGLVFRNVVQVAKAVGNALFVQTETVWESVFLASYIQRSNAAVNVMSR